MLVTDLSKPPRLMDNVKPGDLVTVDWCDAPTGKSSINSGNVDVPDRLYKSYYGLKSIGGKATAQEVCNRSGRTRAAESSSLNELVILGIANKYRAGRKVVFQLVNPNLGCAKT